MNVVVQPKTGYPLGAIVQGGFKFYTQHEHGDEEWVYDAATQQIYNVHPAHPRAPGMGIRWVRNVTDHWLDNTTQTAVNYGIAKGIIVIQPIDILMKEASA